MRTKSWTVLAAAVLIAFLAGCATVETEAKKAPPKPAAKVKIGAVCPKPAPRATSPEAKPAAKPQTAKATPKVLPKLIDLGATTCVPCKMMAPILKELARQYRGKLTVVFIDVWENRDAAGKYNVRTIPTQIFYDTRGEEFYRHVGFFPKADILQTFEDRGIKLGGGKQ